MIRAVAELCDGSPSEETTKLMLGLSNPLLEDPDTPAIHLYGTNFEVDYLNHEKLLDDDGETQIKVYRAQDKGNILITQSKN